MWKKNLFNRLLDEFVVQFAYEQAARRHRAMQRTSFRIFQDEARKEGPDHFDKRLPMKVHVATVRYRNVSLR